MIVVSDTSAIRALWFLNLLDLLERFYGEVIIPPAVNHELRMPPDARLKVDVTGSSFIRVITPIDNQAVQRLRREIDVGESEALVVAQELGADLVLMDEQPGRKMAARLGFATVGVLGILIRAKRELRVAEVRPLLDRLEGELRFFVSAQLRDDVLRLVGEG